MSLERYWTRQEVAVFLRVTRMTLSRWENILPLPGAHKGFRLGRMSEEDILSWHNKLDKKYAMKQSQITWRRAAAAV